jgi:uncharacterized membrane protein YeaQ/YmgE (transglycosylase-associated protein family)
MQAAVELGRLLLLGLAVAVVARLATHGRGRIGVRPGLVLGAAGSVAGGLLAWALRVDDPGRWGVAAAAAVAVLTAAAIAREVASRRAP